MNTSGMSSAVWVDAVALLALLQFFGFAFAVGRARGRYGIRAPAMTGHEVFERHVRVQMNTLELLVMLLPALYIAARYWPPAPVAACGAVYLLGRQLYQRAYVADPARRGPGFLLSMGPVLLLMGAGALGVLRAAGQAMAR
jgi:hypothetical protein